MLSGRLAPQPRARPMSKTDTLSKFVAADPSRLASRRRGRLLRCCFCKGLHQDKKVYGIDPIQSFTLGLKPIEQLTEAKRIGEDDEEPMNGASWRIEVDLRCSARSATCQCRRSSQTAHCCRWPIGHDAAIAAHIADLRCTH